MDKLTYEGGNVVLARKRQDMTAPQLGVWTQLYFLPVEVVDAAHENDGDVGYVSSVPHPLPLVVELHDPLPGQRNMRRPW